MILELNGLLDGESRTIIGWIVFSNRPGLWKIIRSFRDRKKGKLVDPLRLEVSLTTEDKFRQPLRGVQKEILFRLPRKCKSIKWIF